MAKLHLGCGKNYLDGWINIDNDSSVKADVHRDVLRGLPFDSDSIEEVFSENFLEHIPQNEVIFVMNEIWRVLKTGGTAHHVIPHAGTMNRWQDPTHLSDWIPETFRYFDAANPKNQYYSNINPWSIKKLELLNNGQALEVILEK